MARPTGRRGTVLAAVLVPLVGLVAVGLIVAAGSRADHGGHDQVAAAGAVVGAVVDDGVPPADGGHSSGGHVDPAATGPTGSAAATPATPYEALRDRMLGILDRSGPGKALAALDKAIARNPEVSGICHAVAHDIGHATLEKFDGDAARALSQRDDVCGGGYTHGVVELALAYAPDIGQALLEICAPANDGSCFHGVGHGVMFATGYDIPAALDLCDTSPGDILKIRCGEGVFMQLFTLDDGVGHVATPAGYDPPTSETARGICEDVRLPYAGNCWFYAPTVWLQEHPEDWSGVVQWCDEAQDGLGRQTCTRGVGSRAVKYHPDDIPFAAAVCDSVADNVLTDCLGGMGSYWSVHWKGERPKIDVCNHLGDDGTAQRLEPLCREANA